VLLKFVLTAQRFVFRQPYNLAITMSLFKCVYRIL